MLYDRINNCINIMTFLETERNKMNGKKTLLIFFFSITDFYATFNIINGVLKKSWVSTKCETVQWPSDFLFKHVLFLFEII